MRYPQLLKRLADNLRDYRNDAARSQEDVAHAAGLTVRAYGSIERGKTIDPGLQTIHALATALGLDIGDLLLERRPGPRPAPMKKGRKPRQRRVQT